MRLNIYLLVASASIYQVMAQTANVAEKDSVEALHLTEVIVTATRTERQLSSLPLPVTLIDKESIRRTGTVRLNEILNEQTGIITVTDESGFQGIQIQGIASDYILILIDGVPLVGRNAGNFDLSRLTVGNIKQIEVVKGPSSSLYGSEALGGVINIITEKPKGEIFDGNLSYRIGTYSQQDINVDIKQGFKKFRYGFFANRFSSNGYDLNKDIAGQTVNPFKNYTSNGRLYYDFNDKLTLFTSARFYKQVQNGGFIQDSIAFQGDTEEQEWNTHVRLDHKPNARLHTSYEIYYTNYTAQEYLEDPITAIVASNSYFDQKLFRPEIRGSYQFKNPNNAKDTGLGTGTLTAGTGLQYDALERTYFDESVRFISNYMYLQYDVEPLEKLNVIAGLRFDKHSEYNNQFSPKLAIRYKANSTFSIKGSIGYGFKAPDFRQLYFDFTNSAVGYTVLGYNVAIEKLRELNGQDQLLDILVTEDELSRPLEAESSIGYNIGFTHTLPRLTTTVNFFRNDFKNLIDTRIVARKTNGQNVFSYDNFDEIYTTGLELNSKYSPTSSLKLSAGYQLLFAFDKQQQDRVANRDVFVRHTVNGQTMVLEKADYYGLINRSRHNANFKVFYTIAPANTDFNLRVLYRSKYAQYDANGNGLIDTYDNSFINGFLTLNAAAAKTFYKKLNLQVGANNLLDYTDSNIPSMPGIQAYIKLNYQF
ncbi:outer membrane receptor for ferrienterochelin and colicins [Maribacter sedimenticola]|uniref:Outer membrane receptor for ferrienterochelin and colicins n=1 Tax=Maribacter sedimenticola TaxID=228956 RepID=A0ABY1SJJ8_9FLAO|nr:TonB-dependent receptor [Maribacter sedimenticola]SNR64869.1 outer membrane receptor for ferrienterochelin and colicins [Maribacter sedimenticola]